MDIIVVQAHLAGVFVVWQPPQRIEIPIFHNIFTEKTVLQCYFMLAKREIGTTEGQQRSGIILPFLVISTFCLFGTVQAQCYAKM